MFAEPAAPIGAGALEAAHVLAAYDALADCDVIHDHTVLGPLLTGGRCPPVVVTHHGPFDDVVRRVFFRVAAKARVVAISRAQAATAGPVPITAVIHHGIDLERYQPGGGGDYLVFVGRMAPQKGVHRAVSVARRAGRRLVLATKMREPAERAYFEQMVRPLLRDDDEAPVERTLSERIALLQGAHALLNPIDWPEPFGLVMAEALAAGTPVITTHRGAAPELVDDGVTGFLCGDEDAMVRAVERVGRLDRGDCRAAAERRFSASRMTRDYEQLFRTLTRPRPRIGLRAQRTLLGGQRGSSPLRAGVAGGDGS